MRVINKSKEFVRVIIGNAKKGKTGISKPIKTISIEDATVNEIYKKIIKIIESDDGNTKD